MFTHANLPDDALLEVREVAQLLSCGVSTVWRDVANGTMPPPIRITPRRPRWKMADLRALVEAKRA